MLLVKIIEFIYNKFKLEYVDEVMSEIFCGMNDDKITALMLFNVNINKE